MSAQSSVQPALSIRRAVEEDAAACGPICYEAFKAINEQHNFPPDVPSPERGIGLLKSMFGHPKFYCVVAEMNGKIVGSNCLDERGMIAGVGPITIDPKVQNQRIGRALMQSVMDRAREQRFAGVRLVQAAFHARSMSLYTKLGFVIREPLVVMQGSPAKRAFEGVTVRAARKSDLASCGELCVRVHGHERNAELDGGIDDGMAKVVERGGRIVAYSSGLAFFGHSVADTTEDLLTLIASAERFAGPGLLVPTRNHELFNGCLNMDLKVVEPMTLMTTGLYNEPQGAYLASILF